ncbi:MAG: Glyoxalase family protein [uncultured Adhaeribacter sp.]|uniref:Glyoxalase family protein n=1 Tax=uncultured Adhaeribacter sp. TaxID=448109 RepID=A0A6J4JV26_9BACT|nr:MAG: Glyoxalase family protein [uncultured Adhaeribacter sp.]
MTQQLGQITLVVLDYDEAIRYYTQRLNFDLLEDTALSPAKRWVRVAPKGSSCSLLLAKATSETQKQSVGNQTGGRVFLFLYTDDFWRDYENMKNAGVIFTREPTVETYGTVAVFQDLYGNLWDFIQPAL